MFIFASVRMLSERADIGLIYANPKSVAELCHHVLFPGGPLSQTGFIHEILYNFC